MAHEDTPYARDVFAHWCSLSGLDLPDFDQWHATLPESRDKDDLAKSREAAFQAVLLDDTVLATLHLLHLTNTVRTLRLMALAAMGAKQSQKQRERALGAEQDKLERHAKVRGAYAEHVEKTGKHRGAIAAVARRLQLHRDTVSDIVNERTTKKTSAE